MKKADTSDSERDIEKFFVATVEALGGEALKLEVKSRRGWPDRLVIMPCGVTVFVELKKPTGTLAKLQKLRMARLHDLGHGAVCLWSKSSIVSWGRNMAWMHTPEAEPEA